MKKDKFQIGNILCHVPSKTRWIIMERNELSMDQTSFWRLKVTAYCIYQPKKTKLSARGMPTEMIKYSDTWKTNKKENFILQDKDLSPQDKIWQVLHEKS